MSLRPATETEVLRRRIAELEQQLKAFNAVLAPLQEFVYLLDRDGRFRYANQPLLQLWGLTLEQVTGKTFAELGYPAELVRLHEEQLRRVVQTGRPVDGENAYTSPAGVTGYYEYSFVPLLAPDGSVEAVGGHTRDVTERQRAGVALRASEIKYRTLFESIDQGFCIIEMLFDGAGQPYDYRFLAANPAFEKHTGLRDATGKTTRELVPHLDRHWFEIYGQVALTGQATRFVDHSEPLGRWFDVYAFRIGLPAARHVAILFSDITERTAARRKLEFLNALAEATRELDDPAAVMVVITRLLGEHLRASRCAYADVESDTDRFTILHDYNAAGVGSARGSYQLSLFGPRAAADQRAGRTLVIHDVDRELEPDAGSAMFHAIGIQAIICCPLLKQGRLVAMMAVHHSAPRRWTADEVALVEASVERAWAYIERSRAVRTLRESEERFRAIVSQATAGIAQVDLSGRFTLVNDRFCAIAGRSREELGALRMEDITHPEDVPGNAAQFQRAVHSGEPFVVEKRYLRPDGSTVWVANSVSLVRDAAGRPESIIAITHDISERKQAEAALRRSNEELARVNRELEEFAYVASHDLQEPLRMVNIYTQQLLRRFVPDAPEAREYAGFIQRGVSRMQDLVRDLLDFSRTVHSDPLPVNGAADLAASLTEALTVLQKRVEENGARIEAGPLPLVRGETRQLAHVFQNLIGNSLKYRQPDVPPVITITAAFTGNEWVIAVADNGIGFNQEYAGKIFGLFKRLHKDEYPGTGLGLAICQRIVERYGGRMWAEGRPGQGATFFFALPAAS